MARRYTRDNRGRFASTGATARGGRLKTASGAKRERQTMAVKGGGKGAELRVTAEALQSKGNAMIQKISLNAPMEKVRQQNQAAQRLLNKAKSLQAQADKLPKSARAGMIKGLRKRR